MPVPRAGREPVGNGLKVSLKPLKGLTDTRFLSSELVLQCAPIDDFGPQFSWSYTDYETIGFGIHSKPGSAQLATVTISSLFVDRDYPFTLWKSKPNDPANPIHQAKELKDLGDSMTPFLLLAGQESLWHVDYDVNMAATLRAFAPIERPGENDARYYSATFTEFRGVSEDILQAGLAAEGKWLAVLLIRTLPPGMRTMVALAKKYYKSASAWRAISKSNGLHIDGNRDLVAYAKHDPTRMIVIPPMAKKQSPQIAGGGGGRSAMV